MWKNKPFFSSCKSKQNQPRPKARKYRKGREKFIHPLKHDDSDNSDKDYLYAVNKDQGKFAKVKVKVCGASFMPTMDIRATINVIEIDSVQLKSINTKAFPYNSAQPVKFLGKFDTVIETRKRLSVAMFYVVKGQNSGNLLSPSTVYSSRPWTHYITSQQYHNKR